MQDHEMFTRPNAVMFIIKHSSSKQYPQAKNSAPFVQQLFNISRFAAQPGPK